MRAVEEIDDTAAFIGALSSETSNSWTVDVAVSGTSISFKIDTGAEVTMISEVTVTHMVH